MGKIVAFNVGIICSWASSCSPTRVIININYDALQQWGSELFGQVGALEGVLPLLIANLPFAAILLVGLAIGLKMG